MDKVLPNTLYNLHTRQNGTKNTQSLVDKGLDGVGVAGPGEVGGAGDRVDVAVGDIAGDVGPGEFGGVAGHEVGVDGPDEVGGVGGDAAGGVAGDEVGVAWPDEVGDVVGDDVAVVGVAGDEVGGIAGDEVRAELRGASLHRHTIP